MAYVQLKILVKAPIEVCFDYARDIDLHTKTVWEHTKENAIEGTTTGKIGEGEVVTFEATHFRIKQKLTSKIVEYNRPYLFIDEMQRGAFKYMKHTHTFEKTRQGTIMIDTLNFSSPFGILGKVFDIVILERYMRSFVQYRQQKLKEFIEKNNTEVFINEKY